MIGLPDGWAEAPLIEVARLGSGGTPQAKNPAFYGGDIPWAIIGDLNDAVVRSTAQKITLAGLQESSAKIVPADTILIGMYGSIGKLGIAGIPMATNQAIATIQVGKQVDVRYLFYYLLAERRELDRSGKGAAQRNISQTVLKPWPVRFPQDVSEQRRIVDLLEDHLSRLDAADAYLNAAQSRASALLQTVRQAVWRELDGRVRIGDVGAVITGRTPPMSDPASLGCDMPFVTPSDIEFGAEIRTVGRSISRHGAASSRTASPGSVLAVCIGATLGKVGFSNREVSFNQQINAIVLSSRDQAEFLAGVMAAPGFQRQMWESSSATTMPILNKSTFARLEVPAASETDVTRCLLRLRDAASATARLQKEAQRAATRSAILRRSLLAAAFSGRLTGDRAIAGV